MAAVRKEFGYDVPLQVDANAAYTLVDAQLLRRLDEFALLSSNSPLAEDDLVQHAKLAQSLSTPICLDESVESAKDAADAITLGAASVINIKPSRVGGYLESQAHPRSRLGTRYCGVVRRNARDRNRPRRQRSPRGAGRIHAAGDISASDRFYKEDITEPFVIEDGHIAVPQGPGFGVTPREDVMDRFTVGTEIL